MSNYTTALRWVIEQATPGMAGQGISKRIEAACSTIFDFEYPIWTPAYRRVLEKKILMHYFNREIGAETVALWKLWLEERLNLIMPYYNQLYATTVMDYDPLTDTKSEEVYTGLKNRREQADFLGSEHTSTHDAGSTDETTSASSTSDSAGTHDLETITSGHVLNSDLPQANYNNLDYGTDLKEQQTNVNTVESTTDKAKGTSSGRRDVDTSAFGTSDSRSESTNSIGANEDENYKRLRTGNFGSRSFTELMMQYRASLINIDKMVIDELSDLFMTIY